MKYINFLFLSLLFLTACKSQTNEINYEVIKTDNEWREQLDQMSYLVLRKAYTERPYTGKYDNFYEKGTYHCAGCNEPLYKSNNKYNSFCGWPSFDQAIEGTIKYVDDYSHNMVRTEIVCVNCGGHLGHVFNDGPTETGLRYCVNSVSIDFNNDPNKK